MRPAPSHSGISTPPGCIKWSETGRGRDRPWWKRSCWREAGPSPLREDGPRVHTEARRQNDGQGALQGVAAGRRKGTAAAGNAGAGGGELVLSRTLSRRTLEDAGCWPVAGGRAVMAYPFTEESAGGVVLGGGALEAGVRPSAGAGGPELGAPAGAAGRGGGAAGRLLPRRRAVPAGPPCSASGRWARSGEGNM